MCQRRELEQEEIYVTRCDFGERSNDGECNFRSLFRTTSKRPNRAVQLTGSYACTGSGIDWFGLSILFSLLLLLCFFCSRCPTTDIRRASVHLWLLPSCSFASSPSSKSKSGEDPSKSAPCLIEHCNRDCYPFGYRLVQGWLPTPSSGICL